MNLINKLNFMNLLFANPLFMERITQALCWTLLHSLWQGLLLAIFAGIVILFTRRSAPLVRYGLFATGFFLFFLGSCFTFVRQWHIAADAGRSGAVVEMRDQPSVGTMVQQGVDGAVALPVHSGLMDRMASYCNEHAYFIVGLWLLIFSARLMRIIAQLATVQRLTQYRVHAPDLHWKGRLQELADGLGIRTTVRLLESEIVKVPMMTGFIKPVILLPFSLLSQLPASEIEAILLHELAHIRRGDYLVNLLFSLAELLFFFNPGVLWICSLIREERENCCDDIAVRQAGSKKAFISALVSFQQPDRKAALSAMAFAGRGNHLLGRARRIIYRDNKILDGREKFFLLLCFLISGILMVAFTYGSRGNDKGSHRVSPPMTSPLPQGSLSLAKDVLLRDSVPGDAGDRDNKESIEALQKRVHQEERKIEKLQAELVQREIAVANRERVDAYKDTADRNQRIFETKQKIEKEYQSISAEAGRIQNSALMASMWGNQKLLLPIIDELKREHLIGDGKEFSFTLTDEELNVNGAKQPEPLHQQFRQKYLGRPKDFVIYSRTKNGMESSSVNIHSKDK